jgi:nucleoside-diphosphate-sugar epimerase
MSKILITGTNSFVGTNFINYSKFSQIDEVSLLDKNPEDINYSGYDVIIHLVAIVHQTVKIPEEMYFRVNRDLCVEVAKLAKKAGVKQFVFLSTVKVYGKFIQGYSYWNEKSSCYPDDYYGKSKYAAELALQSLNDKDFIVSVVRTPLVYGEGVKANMLSMLKLVNMSRYLPFKDVHNRRSFTSAENLVAFIDRIIEKRAAGIFIAMDRDAISTTDLVLMISETLGKKRILFKLPDFVITAGIFLLPKIFERLYGSFEMDNAETLKILDFIPPVSTHDGIQKIARTFRDKKSVTVAFTKENHKK